MRIIDERRSLTAVWLARLALGSAAEAVGAPPRPRLPANASTSSDPRPAELASGAATCELSVALGLQASALPRADEIEAEIGSHLRWGVGERVKREARVEVANRADEERYGRELAALAAAAVPPTDIAEPRTFVLGPYGHVPPDMPGYDPETDEVALPIWTRVSAPKVVLVSTLAAAVADDPETVERLATLAGPAAIVVRPQPGRHIAPLAEVLVDAVLPRVHRRGTLYRLRDEDPYALVAGSGSPQTARLADADDMDLHVWDALADAIPVVGISDDPVHHLTPELVAIADPMIELGLPDAEALLTVLRWSGRHGLRPWCTASGAESTSLIRTDPNGMDPDTGSADATDRIRDDLQARAKVVLPSVTLRGLMIACAGSGFVTDCMAALEAMVSATDPAAADAANGAGGKDAPNRPNAPPTLPEIARRLGGRTHGDADYLASPGAQAHPVGWRPPVDDADKKAAQAAGEARKVKGWKVPDVAKASPGPTLDQLVGYGAAKQLGLDLAADLQAWQAGELAWTDVPDTAILLSGPPGTGKTTYAAALARTLDLPLVASSVADWTAAEYLSGTLQAMQATFDLAKAAAPCVLLIDEIDALGNRQSLSGEYVEYWEQIINRSLTLLQGAAEREGVVIVGASNYPDRLDPAIVRSGRLDRHIRIERPDASELAAIFEMYLAGDMTPLEQEHPMLTDGGTASSTASVSTVDGDLASTVPTGANRMDQTLTPGPNHIRERST